VFCDPIRVIEAHRLEDVEACFEQVQEATADGLYVAGYVAYEAGYALQGMAVNPQREERDGAAPLLWFGVYAEPAVFDHHTGAFAGAPLPETLQSDDPVDGEMLGGGPVKLSLSAADHAAKVERIKQRIAAGDTYQINLTDRVELASAYPPAAVYAAVAEQQPVAYAALLNMGTTQVLSFSPELFFRVRGGKIVTRPMKGTWPRGRDAAEDVLGAMELQHDEKNRSEHLMIVDLLRNDLGRLCENGSICVEDMFSVERYPSLLQMTSTVSGTLRGGTSWPAVFRALFPSGSITGAPKISSMKIIRELESSPRGVYTGAIGYIAPGGDACFNVAIRTLVQRGGGYSMGVGGGIVADSDAAEEYAECELKTAFLKRSPQVELIETMRWDGGYARLERHMERLGLSCEYFGFPFDLEQLTARLAEAASGFEPLTQQRVRLTLDRRGEIGLTINRLQSAGAGTAAPACRVGLASEEVFGGDLYLRHKTTRRELYEREWAAAQARGLDDVLFFNERGELTEGAISNVFLRLNGVLCTPALGCGVLPGVFRRYLLETLPAAEERMLTRADLAAAAEVFLCNSVRGLRRVTELQMEPAAA
jgi:para-aminobenzoate synthetase/4-amino-4-deoxychorismate lyase